MVDLNFYLGKRVFVTGHTGFKGSWLCHILKSAGAEVTGFSLEPVSSPNLFGIADIANGMRSIIGDIRDYSLLEKAYTTARPEIVFHLAAQALVLEGYRYPLSTYDINVMGTVNLLECLRRHPGTRSFVNVTTDKVYLNSDAPDHAFTEDEPLDGFDPYSNSKSCSELVTHSYANSFFKNTDLAVSTARAGNVIGGGDFSDNRIIPDCVRAAIAGDPIQVRNPNSVRPYQHVLEPLFAYLMIAKEQYEDVSYAGCYNIGPDEVDCLTTHELATTFCALWEGACSISVAPQDASAHHEAGYLRLNNEKLKKTFGWQPRWNAKTAVEKTVEWTRVWHEGADVFAILACMSKQVVAYQLKRANKEMGICSF